jgi:type I restriction enzyme S subunit
MGSSKYISRTQKMLSCKGFKVSRQFPAGSVLFVCIGSTIGKTALAPVLLTSNQQINAVLPSEDVAAEYLYYCLSGAANRIKALAGEQAVPLINKSQFSQTMVPLPSARADQEAIAEALSDADALIESLEQLLTKKRQIKQGAMQDLLTGKKRLPGFQSNPGYKQTEVGTIPEDWEVTTVERVSTVGRGRVISHKEIARSRNPRYPVYSSQTSNEGVMGYLDSYEFDGEYITWTTDGANAGTVFHRNGKFNCTNVCGTIKLNSDNHLFVSKVLAGFAPAHVSRHLGNPKLMNDVMKKVKFPLPPALPEQNAIASLLSDIDVEFSALETKLTKARQLKQGMMQELLTGRTRLV